jgi:ribosomal protein S18 acetylase RimI-like enzyme
MEIRRLGPDGVDAVVAASPLFDGPALADASQRFLDAPDHFLFVAYDDDAPIGFVTGIEMIHPDKGAEMFLYELAVTEAFRQQGVGTELVGALRALAEERGCYGMWVLTDDDNIAACATYTAAGSAAPTSHVMFTWDFRPRGSS